MIRPHIVVPVLLVAAAALSGACGGSGAPGSSPPAGAARSTTPSLQTATTRFANSVKAQDLVGIAVSFTPEGLSKAMALQQHRRDLDTITGNVDVDVQEQTPEAATVRFVAHAATGTLMLTTRWVVVGGAWMVSDLVTNPP